MKISSKAVVILVICILLCRIIPVASDSFEGDNIMSSLSGEVLSDLISRLVQSYKIDPIDKEFPVLAVIPFQSVDPKLQKQRIGYGIAEIILPDIFKENLFTIVERNNLESVLQELKLSMTGLIDERSAVKAGKLLSADILLIGSVSKVGNDYIVIARIVKTDTGEILTSRSMKFTVKSVHREAKEYLNLPKKWGLYFHTIYINLTPLECSRPIYYENSGLEVSGFEAKNNTDFSGWWGFTMGLRCFIIEHILLDWSLLGFNLGNAAHDISLYEDGVWVRDYVDLQDKRLHINTWLNIAWAQELGPGYLYFGIGAAFISINVPPWRWQEGWEWYDSWLVTPIGKIGYEWRVRERIGLALFAQYLFKSRKVEGTLPISEESGGNQIGYLIYDFEFFKIEPLSFVFSLGYYF